MAQHSSLLHLSQSTYTTYHSAMMTGKVIAIEGILLTTYKITKSTI